MLGTFERGGFEPMPELPMCVLGEGLCVNRRLDQSLNESRASGAATLVNWAGNGTLITGEQLALAWGLAANDVDAAVLRGDLFQVWVDGVPFFPVALVPFGLDRAAQVCRHLEGNAASSKLLFLQRPHGRLSGKTVVESLQSSIPLGEICELAAQWKFA